ncbi:MAG TPA: 23S rRNA (uridine(2552)-2'-O)-methyltransferase RlmE [Chromatiales bacterium]|nr:23S rRNA (uridine(2552)-2'-O)-methyltransferase RlmE [Thiotrichales bacterium]HIP68076.1 23S rRNA (uridine(2552)-2'-O)-methyltransferase RlmE [Chromatiales bacterium]
MGRSKSSQKWLREHFSDEYVQRAQQEGYRGRAVYKLLELDERYHFLKPGMTVLDLGAAPGSWSEVAVKKLGRKGKMIASDILLMDEIEGVVFIRGDFREDEVLNKIMAELGGQKVDLVLSDMAPNMSGVDAIDLPRAMYLAELALDLATRTLRNNGSLLVKLFHGDGFDDYVRSLKNNFSNVIVRKPKASRPRSREVYALASGYNL